MEIRDSQGEVQKEQDLKDDQEKKQGHLLVRTMDGTSAKSSLGDEVKLMEIEVMKAKQTNRDIDDKR